MIFGTLPDCSLLHVDALTARTDNQASLFRSIPVKQSARPSRTPSKLSDSVHQRLNMYALAGAAGMGVLALTHPAEAKIVYTPAHHVIRKNGRYKLDLNHDKIADFTLANMYGCNTDYCYGVFSAIPSGGNGVDGVRGFLSIPYASALMRGAQIGPKAHFSGRLMASSNMGAIGQWINVTNRYLGLKFTINGKTHYGWARLNVQIVGNGVVKGVLTGYAYETIPNKPIIAGKTHGEDNYAEQSNPASLTSPTPRPATLGLLAIGAPGLSIRKREPVGAAK
jgi:hypothetical protein